MSRRDGRHERVLVMQGARLKVQGAKCQVPLGPGFRPVVLFLAHLITGTRKPFAVLPITSHHFPSLANHYGLMRSVYINLSLCTVVLD